MNTTKPDFDKIVAELYDKNNSTHPSGGLNPTAFRLGAKAVWDNYIPKPPTEEEKDKFVIETLAPILRTGFNRAIQELEIWLHSKREVDPLEVYAKLQEMRNNKREIITTLIAEEL